MVTRSLLQFRVHTAAVHGTLVQETILLARPQETLVHRKKPNGATRDVVQRCEEDCHDPRERDEHDLGLLHLGPCRLEENA